MNRIIVLVSLLGISTLTVAQTVKEDSAFVRENYVKMERMIPMRDGVKLFTAIYTPKDQTKKYALLMSRTPYSWSPYGEEKYPKILRPNSQLMRELYIFVSQDVRGRYMSEGEFKEMTPHIANKKTKKDVDESSDTFDTIEWLLKNVKNNNGRVGISGISYPGFYATAALPESHPAVKAVSPQAPVTDEFQGDDAYHNGAFFLLDNFGFMNYFDHPRTSPWIKYPQLSAITISNAYDFFLELGPIKNANERYFNKRSKIWNEYVEHNTYDEYWKARNIRPHLKNIKPAVMVVGGWFDPEDLFGPLRTFETLESGKSLNKNYLIMGPWTHGAWAAKEWNKYVSYDFGSNVNTYYQELETSFFNFYLKDKGTLSQKKAVVFETGSNQWKSFETWPPKDAQLQKIYLQDNGKLSFTSPDREKGFDEYVSDPSRPVPYTDKYQAFRDRDYMALDQRFAATRSDVMVYKTEVLEQDITLNGPLTVDFFVSTSGTDLDLVVKVIDVLPEWDVQQLVRGDVFRGKFRTSYEKPEPFVPGQTTEVKFALNDVAHTFKKGHRIMIHIQNSWFPLVDRNPQKFVDIGKADETDFQKATQRLYRDRDHASHIVLPVMK